MELNREERLKEQLDEAKKQAEYERHAWNPVTCGLVFFGVSCVILWPVFEWLYYNENFILQAIGYLVTFCWIFFAIGVGNYIADRHNAPIKDELWPKDTLKK